MINFSVFGKSTKKGIDKLDKGGYIVKFESDLELFLLKETVKSPVEKISIVREIRRILGKEGEILLIT